MVYVSYLATNPVLSAKDLQDLRALLLPFGMQLLEHKSLTHKCTPSGLPRQARIPKVVEACGTDIMVQQYGSMFTRSTMGTESDFALKKQVQRVPDYCLGWHTGELTRRGSPGRA